MGVLKILILAQDFCKNLARKKIKFLKLGKKHILVDYFINFKDFERGFCGENFKSK